MFAMFGNDIVNCKSKFEKSLYLDNKIKLQLESKLRQVKYHSLAHGFKHAYS